MISRFTLPVTRAICYLRKSREDEEAERRGEDTLAKQRELLLNGVLQNAPFPFDVGEEVASGDSIRERPVFQALLDDLGRRYNAIICKDLSRLGRGSYGDMGVVYDLVRESRIFIFTKDSVYDPANFSDLRMIRFSLFFNREEYEMTLWRMTEGKYDGAARGRWVAGSVPFGYRYNRQLQSLEPDPIASEIVKYIFQLSQDGAGPTAISRKLEACNVPSPRGKATWHPEVIRRILNNPAYCGTLIYRRTKRNKRTGKVQQRPEAEQIVVEDAFLPLIAPDQHRSTESPVERNTTFLQHPFSGIVTCKTCGNHLVKQTPTKKYMKKEGSVSVYRQTYLYCRTCRYAVSYNVCEQMVRKILAMIALPKREEVPSEETSPKALEGFVQEREMKLQMRLQNAEHFLLDGVFSKEQYTRIVQQIEMELAALRSSAHRDKKLTRETPWTNLHEVYEDVSHPSRRRLIQFAFSQIEVVPLTKNAQNTRCRPFQLSVSLSESILATP